MASNRIEKLIGNVKASDIAGCVQPSAPFHHDVAVTLAKWEALEEAGYVRLVWERDYDYDPRDFDDEEHDWADYEAYGSIGEFRLHENGKWHRASSVWGHVGYKDVLDWRENVCIVDIMTETISAFRDAWKEHVSGVCPTCHGTGRI